MAAKLFFVKNDLPNRSYIILGIKLRFPDSNKCTKLHQNNRVEPEQGEREANISELEAIRKLLTGLNVK